MKRGKLSFVFFLSFFYALVVPILLPSLRLAFFVPFLILTIYSTNLVTSLWISLGIGLILDLFSPDSLFGMFALTYCGTIALLYKQKQTLFEDQITTIPLFTFFFSMLSTIIQLLLVYAFNGRPMISWSWAGSDLIAWPLLDAVYAILGIMLPLRLLKRLKLSHNN